MRGLNDKSEMIPLKHFLQHHPDIVLLQETKLADCDL